MSADPYVRHHPTLVSPARPTPVLDSSTADVPDGWTAAASRLLAVLFVLVALETLVSVPKLTWDLAVGGREWMGVALGLIVAAGAAGVVWTGKDRIAALLSAAGLRLARIPRRSWLAGVIVAGVALRVAWVLVFPAPYTSDGADYYHLGGHLARGEAYHSAAGYAEWPPGYPLVLALHFAVLGVGSLGVTVANLLLFAGALLVVQALALRLLGEGPARLATLLFALWPNLVAAAGVASKEMVLVLFLPLVLLLYLQVDEKRTPAGRAAAALGAGLALGFSILTQPGVLLMVVIFPVFELLRRTPLLRIAGKLAVLAVGTVIVVAPWTLRNYGVFHQPVLVSSNGGSVFYRSNNPLATGGFIANGERSLKGYDELTANRLGYQWGEAWIREHPGQFLRLGVRKQVLFLGDDAGSVYETLKRGLKLGGALYAVSKLAANAWWLAIWVLVLAAFLVHRRLAWHRRQEVVLFLLTILYFWAIDSVFESGSRHHLPVVGLLAIFAAGAAGAVTVRSQSSMSSRRIP
ncbi:MAG: glycosyltransferase family 39 protein [Acidobacteria bacterium]|nr:glycosyltransferase family 39 protein [Acidobacteriota bacterium]